MRLNNSQSTDSLGSRRPARAALPPFTLPPPPEIPRAGAATATATAADNLSLATGGVRSAGDSSSHSASTSALSSPGFSAPAMSSYGSPRQGNNTPVYPAQYGPGSRFHGSPGRPQQPIAPKPPAQSPHKQQQQQQLSPPRPSPSSPSVPSGFGEKLPPIASLMSPGSPLSSHYGPMPPNPHAHHRPHPHPAARSQDPPGHLAPPVGIPLSSGSPNPPFYRVPHPSYTYSPGKPPPGNFPKFNVGKDPFSIRREPLQQERPFKCDKCAQSFSRNHDLKRHKRIHLAAKPFPCPHCQKCFSRKDALKRHTLVKACGSRKSLIKSENEIENSEPASPSPAPSSSASISSRDEKIETTARPQSETSAKDGSVKRNTSKKGTARKSTSKRHDTDGNPVKEEMTEDRARMEDVAMEDGDSDGAINEVVRKDSVASSPG